VIFKSLINWQPVIPTYTHGFNGSRVGFAHKIDACLSNGVVKQNHVDAVMKFLLFGRFPVFHLLVARTDSNAIKRAFQARFY
jgi:hypothetical protein